MTNKFTIIIPTLNEEKYLPKLLESIKKQSIIPHEIIIPDYNSQDNTVSIVRSHGCKVIKGGNVSQARNNGWKEAKTDILVFMDSDTYLDAKNLLEEAITEFENKKLDYANSYYKNTPENKTFISRMTIVGHNIRSYLNRLSIKLLSANIGGSGAFIITNNSTLEIVDGFDESLHMNEDSDIVSRVIQNKLKFGYLHIKVPLSGRRYASWNIFKVAKLIFIQCTIDIYRILGLNTDSLHRNYQIVKGNLGGEIEND